jgi:hypothetical protein
MIGKKNGVQHLIKFMLKFELKQMYKQSIKICYGGKISGSYVAQIL